MDELTWLFAALLLLLLLLVWIALRWTASGYARLGILACFVLLLPAAYAAPASLLGRAKPVSLEWVGAKVREATILSATMVEGKAIYLTLRWHEAPNLYRLPWDRRMAEQLQQALKEAGKNGTNPVMRLPFEPSWDKQEPRFYALPQPKLPDKPAPGPGVEFDRHT